VPAGYKQTEVGVIPEDWDVERLGELSESVTSGSRGWAHFYSDSGALFIRSQNVRDGQLSFDDLQYVSPPAGAEGNRTKVKLNDLLITITGNSVGNVALVDQSFDEAYISQHVGLVRFKEPKRGAYICRYLSPNSPGNPQIAGSQSGQSKPGLNLQNLRNFRIALPPTPTELHAIAEALSDADALIESLEQLLAKKRQLKQGAMQELLTGKKRLPGFSGEWEVKRLGDVADTDSENLGSDTHPNFAFNYIALEDVDMGRLSGYSEHVFPTAPSRARRRLRKHDVLVSTVRPNLMSHLLFTADGNNWVCSTGFCVVRCREDLSHPGYLYFHMFGACVARQIEALLTGSNYPAINGSDVQALQIPFPKYEEQTAIAAILSDMDAEIAALEAKLAKARDLKQGMMQELLTGRIRLV
jgi:type I restriction enzyme S subunit